MGHQRHLSHLPLPDKKQTLQALPSILQRLRIFYDIQLYDEQYQIHASQKIKNQIIESSALEFLLSLTLEELEQKTAFLEQIIPETNSVIINKKNTSDIINQQRFIRQTNDTDFFLKFVTLTEELANQTSANSPVSKHLRLINPYGPSGYSYQRTYVNHPYYALNARGEKILKPASNLIQQWLDFIRGAKSELMINIYDFDITEVAQAIVDQAKKRPKMKITIGIDAQVSRNKANVEKIIQLLKTRDNITVHTVESVGLNHQKIAVRDWSHPTKAKVLLSSGNLTYSCLHPKGDLYDRSLKLKYPKFDKKFGLPNANHLITMNSWVFAQLLHHEMTKTLTLGWRGKKQYPLSGSFQITGPGVNQESLEAYPHPSLVTAFAPNGGASSVAQPSINQHLLVHFIEHVGRQAIEDPNAGPVQVRMLQFAFSSEAVVQALFSLAQQQLQQQGQFYFASVGDRLFTLTPKSSFLKMQGLKIIPMAAGSNEYFWDPQNPWFTQFCKNGQLLPTTKNSCPDILSWFAMDLAACKIPNMESLMGQLAPMIRVAAPQYGTNKVLMVNLQTKQLYEYELSAKIHHKIMALAQGKEEFAVMGSSFNFSKNAEINNEQIVIFKSKDLYQIVNGMTEYLGQMKGSQSVFEQAIMKNKFNPAAASSSSPTLLKNPSEAMELLEAK